MCYRRDMWRLGRWVEKESVRLDAEDEEECKAVVKMNMSYEIALCIIMKCISSKWTWDARWTMYYKSVRIKEAVPEMHFVALLQLKAPARTISVESTLALNPWCCGAKVVYVHTPGTNPPQCKVIRDSLNVLPKLEKSQETCSNTLHMANYCPAARACTPLTQVPHVPQVPPKGTQEHKALVWVEYKLWRSLWNKVL